MPRRSILSAAERASLLALPDTEDELIRHYTFSASDLSLIRQRRSNANRLGVAVQLCLLRFPGQGLLPDAIMPMPLLQWIGQQLRLDLACWPRYAEREETRREHLLELRAYLGIKSFSLAHYRQALHATTELALQTDKGIVLASSVLDLLRYRQIILPPLDVIERICAEAITRANRRIYDALTEPLSDAHRHRLDDLLKRRDNGKTTWLAWLRQSPAKPNSRHMLEHIDRLKAWQALDLPSGIERLVHQNRLLKIAREGGQMTPADLAKFEAQRRYATLVALAIEGMATVTDEIIDLHDRILGKLFNAAKKKHQQQFQASGKAINAKVRLFGRIGQALIDARQSGGDPFAAIESVLSWDAFAESISEAQKLAQPEDFDFLHRIGERYATLRRYTPEFLAVLKLRAAPAAKEVLDA
jgi:TnpA family transposase